MHSNLANRAAQAARRDDGIHYEQRAAEWLTDQGLALVACHVTTRRGEIDLIMASGATAVIVEVRCRRSVEHGDARESIDWHKRQRIIHTALVWWSQVGRLRFDNLRFDTVSFGADRKPVWTVHAFDAEGSV